MGNSSALKNLFRKEKFCTKDPNKACGRCVLRAKDYDKIANLDLLPFLRVFSRFASALLDFTDYPDGDNVSVSCAMVLSIGPSCEDATACGAGYKVIKAKEYLEEMVAKWMVVPEHWTSSDVHVGHALQAAFHKPHGESRMRLLTALRLVYGPYVGEWHSYAKSDYSVSMPHAPYTSLFSD